MTQPLPEWIRPLLGDEGIPEEIIKISTLDTLLREILDYEDTRDEFVFYPRLLGLQLRAENYHDREIDYDAAIRLCYHAPLRDFVALFE